MRVLCGLILLSSFALWLGVADPPHAENLFWQSGDLSTLPAIPVRGNFTLEVTATLPNRQLAEWGIWLDNGNGSWTLVAINGAQYVTARTCPEHYAGKLYNCKPFVEPNQDILTYWKSFHHIRPGGKANTIRLHYTGTVLVLRLNHEWMWDIPVEISTEQLEWGLWVGDDSPQWKQATIWN